MTRRITGALRPHRHGHLSEVPFAPYVNVIVGESKPPQGVDFLIDTGSDFSILCPRDAQRLFGDDYLNWDFSATSSTAPVSVTTNVPARLRQSYMSLTFMDDDGALLALEAVRLRIVEPHPHPRDVDGDYRQHGNWVMPSVLGRDVLQHFDLRLSYHPQSVVLEESSASG